jgi:hypothetical protein
MLIFDAGDFDFDAPFDGDTERDGLRDCDSNSVEFDLETDLLLLLFVSLFKVISTFGSSIGFIATSG